MKLTIVTKQEITRLITAGKKIRQWCNRDWLESYFWLGGQGRLFGGGDIWADTGMTGRSQLREDPCTGRAFQAEGIVRAQVLRQEKVWAVQGTAWNERAAGVVAESGLSLCGGPSWQWQHERAWASEAEAWVSRSLRICWDKLLSLFGKSLCFLLVKVGLVTPGVSLKLKWDKTEANTHLRCVNHRRCSITV